MAWRLTLLLGLTSFASVAHTNIAQDDLTVHEEALATIELPPAFLSDFMFETKDPLGSALGPVADASPAVKAVDSDTAVAVPLADVAWIFATGLIGFVLLSNRRSI
jgi:hypothetical protein